MVTREGVKPFPPTGYRTLDARTAFFYGVTGITPAMAMRLPGVGSQYLFAFVDATSNTSMAPRLIRYAARKASRTQSSGPLRSTIT